MHIHRLITAMNKSFQALKHLPGPKYPFLLEFMELVELKDVHRYATELGERFGPIFKFRIMCFHVCASLTNTATPRSFPCWLSRRLLTPVYPPMHASRPAV